MKKPKTAPQFLEHYTGIDWWELHSFWEVIKEDILKAMRAYANYKIDQEYEKLRAEAIENVEFQYGEKIDLDKRTIYTLEKLTK